MTGTLARQSCRVVVLALLFIGDPHAARATSPVGPTVTIAAHAKQIELSWQAVADASYYVVLESAQAGAPFVAISQRIPQRFVGAPMGFSRDLAVHRTDWLNARYVVQACNSARFPICGRSIEQGIATLELGAIGRLEGPKADAADQFGYAIAASADATTVAIGAPYEDCSCAGVNPTSLDNLATNSGAVYVFAKGADGWTQQAFIKAGVVTPDDAFGMTVALSGDGNTLAIGVPAKPFSAGEVHVYARGGALWKPRAVLTPSNGDMADNFGAALALDQDGAILAVGAHGEDSSGTGTTASGLDNDASGSGAVYMFARASNAQSWSQTAFIKGSRSDAGDAFGVAVALDASGKTLAVGAEREAGSGAVDVYERTSAWSHAYYLRPLIADGDDLFGSSVALSRDGVRLAVGAAGEDGAASGINGNASDNAALESGAAYVFSRSGSSWTQDAYVKASDVDSGDYFGGALALDEHGDTLAVSARLEDGSAAGVSGLADEALAEAGATFLFQRSATDGQWAQARYIKAPNPGASDRFGGTFLRGAIALSGDGDTLIVPAADEDGLNDATPESGAVYLY
jgi:trimeric autotransporter adhesin